MEDFEVVSRNGTAISKALVEIWERFGRPDDFSTKAGLVLLREIISVWKYFFRDEYDKTLQDNKLIISLEKSKSQMKMGYIPIAYPPTLFNLLKAMFPKINFSSRKTQRITQELAPFLKQTSLKI